MNGIIIKPLNIDNINKILSNINENNKDNNKENKEKEYKFNIWI